jgi:hypothetical protein
MVCTGLSAVMGSWNTMPMRLPRSRHICASPAHQFLPVKADAAGDFCAFGQQAHERHGGE